VKTEATNGRRFYAGNTLSTMAVAINVLPVFSGHLACTTVLLQQSSSFLCEKNGHSMLSTTGCQLVKHKLKDQINR